MKVLTFILAGCLFMVACKNKQQESVDTGEISAPSSEEEIVRDNLQLEGAATHAKTVEPKSSTATIDANLLQGTWKSLDDPKSSVSFIDDIKVDAYEGGHTDAGSTFVLTDACQDGTGDTPQLETNRYITVKDKEQCFYIVSLSQQSLEVSQVGRDNTLRYKRARDLQ